jgi:hypothetical protein
VQVVGEPEVVVPGLVARALEGRALEERALEQPVELEQVQRVVAQAVEEAPAAAESSISSVVAKEARAAPACETRQRLRAASSIEDVI